MRKQCLKCGNEFDGSWPMGGKKFCSRSCTQAAWRERHRVKLRVSWRAYTKKYRDARLACIRKYNVSEKGLKTRRKWYDANYPTILKRMLEKYHSDPELRAALLSRARARRKLKASKRPYCCSTCGKSEQLHAHHKDKNPMNNALINLTWLCPRCHRKEHRGV